MNIYEIGKEKQIDGVWGREVNGRFYTHVHSYFNCYLFRKIEINDSVNNHYICRSIEDASEWFDLDPSTKPIPYIPKHIKDLENLKRGDIVWVNIDNLWSPVVFYGTAVGTKYCCLRSYKEQDCVGSLGDILLINEVYLKPPFNLH